MEKGPDKERPKLKSLWSKWSSLFNRSSTTRLRCEKQSIQQLIDDTQIPPIVMNNQPKDMERWSHDDSLDVNSQMLNIPIEPGRQVSTIILSPTKTGFKAVIAHYDVNASLKHSLTKDFKTVSEQIENRRTLTLVFDMNQRTFEEIGVGKSQCKMEYDEQDEDMEDDRNISASALYVRNDVDELVESAAFLQAQLSLDDMALTESSLFISEEKSINLERKHVSCRSIGKSRVAFKTISEPMWREKEKMRKEMLIKQNVQEMLNQFIFLDRDDSLMNYPRTCEEEQISTEEPQCLEEESCVVDEALCEEQAKPEEPAFAETVCAMETVYSEKTVYIAETKPIEEEPILETPEIDSSTESFLPDRFLDSSSRSVAKDLLVNIKPFKEYISCNKADLHMENFVAKKVEPAAPKKADKLPVPSAPPQPQPPPPPPPMINSGSAKKKRSLERSRKLESKVNTKVRPYVCIKCGVEAKLDDSKKASRETTVYGGKTIRSSVTTQTGKSESSIVFFPGEGEKEEIPCTLCSVWKMYKKKSSYTGISQVGDSFEDILKELEGYDHTMIFRQNLSQFKTKINTRTPSIEFKKSHSSLSFAEVIELEEGKISRVKNQRSVDEDAKSDEVPRVTVRVIEFVRKNDEKTVELQRFKKAMEKLQYEKVSAGPRTRIHRMENSSIIFTFRECNKMIKIMAQRIEETMLDNILRSDEVFVSKGSITIIFPAYLGPRGSDVRIARRHSENRLDEFKRNFSSYKRVGQIPDVINQLLTNKVDDLRKELIMKMKETKMSYYPESYHSMQVYSMKRKEEEKSVSKCSVSTTTGSFNSGDESAENEPPPYYNGDILEEPAEEEKFSTRNTSIASHADSVPARDDVRPQNDVVDNFLDKSTEENLVNVILQKAGVTDSKASAVSGKTEDKLEIEQQRSRFSKMASLRSVTSTSYSGERTPTKKEQDIISMTGSSKSKEESHTFSAATALESVSNSQSSLKPKEAVADVYIASNRISFAKDLVTDGKSISRTHSSTKEIISNVNTVSSARFKEGAEEPFTVSAKSSPVEISTDNFQPSTGPSSIKSKEMRTLSYQTSAEPDSDTTMTQAYSSSDRNIESDGYSISRKSREITGMGAVSNKPSLTKQTDWDSYLSSNAVNSMGTPPVSEKGNNSNEAIADTWNKSYSKLRSEEKLGEESGKVAEAKSKDLFVDTKGDKLMDVSVAEHEEKESLETEPLYVNANAFKEVLSFKSCSDYKVQSCLTLFIPYMQQIQTAAEILNNIAYNFPVRKETSNRPERDILETMRSYTVLADGKKHVPDAGVESVITKKCVEKNVVNGVETSKTSKKEITMIESSKSGNHFLVTNKRIFTTNDRIKKREIGGENALESRKVPQEQSTALRINTSEDMEDVNDIHFLYCNRSDGRDTGESSTASSSSYGRGKVRESSSSVIAVNDYNEAQKGFTSVRLDVNENGAQCFNDEISDTENSKPNKVDDSLQETDLGTEQLLIDPMKREVVTLLQKNKDYITKSGESGSFGSASKETKIPPTVKMSLHRRDSVKVKITEENETHMSGKGPSVKVVKKVGKGIVSQRMATRSSGGGRELLIREEDEQLLSRRDSGSFKRMSVVIMLSKRKQGDKERPSSAPGKYFLSNQGSRGMIALTGAQSSKPGSHSDLDLNAEDKGLVSFMNGRPASG